MHIFMHQAPGLLPHLLILHCYTGESLLFAWGSLTLRTHNHVVQFNFPPCHVDKDHCAYQPSPPSRPHPLPSPPDKTCCSRGASADIIIRGQKLLPTVQTWRQAWGSLAASSPVLSDCPLSVALCRTTPERLASLCLRTFVSGMFVWRFHVGFLTLRVFDR